MERLVLCTMINLRTFSWWKSRCNVPQQKRERDREDQVCVSLSLSLRQHDCISSVRLLIRSAALVKLNQRHLLWIKRASVSSHFVCCICRGFLWFCSAILRTLWHRTQNPGTYSGRLACGSDGQCVCVLSSEVDGDPVGWQRELWL